MKDRVQDELKQKYPEPEIEKEQDDSDEECSFTTNLAWYLVALLGIVALDYFFF